MGSRRELSVRFSSLNVRGSTDDKLEEIVRNMQDHGVLARCILETWREGDSELDLRGYTVIQHGLPTRVCNRGSQGVAIVLSPEGAKAWEAAGCEKMYFGTRVMAIRLEFMDDHGRPQRVMLACGYAPVGAAPEEERAEFLDNLSEVVSKVGHREVLLLATDSNASMGTKRGE